MLVKTILITDDNRTDFVRILNDKLNELYSNHDILVLDVKYSTNTIGINTTRYSALIIYKNGVLINE